MHADLMLLYLLCLLDSDFYKEVNLAKFLSILLPSSHRGHPGLAKYRTVWATFSTYFLLDAFSLACAIWIVVCLCQVSWSLLRKL